MDKIKITIGIPAHNEGENIGHLLESIFKQEGDFEIEEIIVMCDGCTDNTTKIIELTQNNNPGKIKCKNFKDRQGKPVRINQILTITKSDIAIILDADIFFSNNKVITNLIYPLIKDSTVSHVSGYAMPLKPKNIIQRIAYTGVHIWDDTRQSVKDKSLLYVCEGTIRAFRRDLFSKMRFPNASADDAFSYLYCISNGYKFSYAPKALVYYQLPKTLTDYLKGLKRIAKSRIIQSKYFDDSIIKKYYVINIKTKMQTVLEYLIYHPIWTVSYIFIVLFSWSLAWIDINNLEGVWEIIRSTKKLE